MHPQHISLQSVLEILYYYSRVVSTCLVSTTVFSHSQATAKEQNITIKSSGGLSDADIEKMVRDAEQYATADKAKKEAIEAKNTLETAIYSAEKSFAEYKVRRAYIDLTLDRYVAPKKIL